MIDLLPDNDPDLKLARRIGEAREKNYPLSDVADPLVNQLLSYKNDAAGGVTVTESEKEEVWIRIANAVEPSPEQIVTPLFSASTIRWAAAAALLIGGLLSFVYFQFYNESTLIASSGEVIETITLDDKSSVMLRPHSQLYALEQTGSTHKYELHGEALFNVTDNPGRSFSVLTDNGNVSVLGTRFTVSSWGKTMRVFLDEGSLQVQNAAQDTSVILRPGQSASIDAQSRIMLNDAANAKEFTDWLNQQLVFEEKSTEFIVRELEQQFNIFITLPGSVAKESLSGRLSLVDVQTALTDLELVLGGEFIETGNRKYRFKK